MDTLLLDLTKWLCRICEERDLLLEKSHDLRESDKKVEDEIETISNLYLQIDGCIREVFEKDAYLIPSHHAYSCYVDLSKQFRAKHVKNVKVKNNIQYCLTLLTLP